MSKHCLIRGEQKPLAFYQWVDRSGFWILLYKFKSKGTVFDIWIALPIIFSGVQEDNNQSQRVGYLVENIGTEISGKKADGLVTATELVQQLQQ